MADKAGTGADGSGEPGGTGTPYKVFTTEEEFQRALDAAEAKGRQIAERRAKAVTADERAKMDAMAEELEARKQRDLEAQHNYDEAKAQIAKQAQARIEAALGAAAKAKSVLQGQVAEQIRALAAAHGAYDPEDVVVRLLPRISLDEDYRVHVSDAPGGTVQDGVTVEQAITELLAKSPHLVKATSSGRGAGSQGGSSTSSLASSTPAVREAQARVDAADAKVRANPRDATLMGELIAARRALTQAQAK